MNLSDSIKEALNQIRSNSHSVITAVGIISIILLVFGMYLLAIYNINNLVENLKKDMQVIAYFDKALADEEINSIKNEIEGFKEVGNVTYIPKDQALEILAHDVENAREIVKELKGNPLPDSMRITLKSDARTPEGIKRLAARLKDISAVNEVEYGVEWVERLNVFISTARVIGVVSGGLMILIVLLTISNTVKFTLLVRREHFENIQYGGNADSVKKLPYVIEGGILGLIGGVCSLILLLLVYNLILYKIPPAVYVWLGGLRFSFIPFKEMLLLPATGIITGCFGSWVSIGKFTNGKITGGGFSGSRSAGGRYTGVAIFLILCLNVTDISYAKSKSGRTHEGQPEAQNIEKEIAQKRKKLEDLSKEIKEKKKASKEAAVEEKKVKQVIETKEKDLDSKKKELVKVHKTLEEKDKEIKNTQSDMSSLTSDLVKKKREMADFLIYVYKSHSVRNTGLAANIVASNDYHDFMLRSKYEDKLIGETNRIMQGLGDEVDKLHGQLSLLNRRHNTLVSEKGKLQKDKQVIEGEVKESRVKLVSIQDRKAEYEKDLQRLESASAALKGLIESYERKRSSEKVVSPGTGIGKEKGRLTWPLAGDVMSRFGKQKHPEFDAYVFKKGIEIIAGNEKNVKAVYNGIVAYADWLKGYGLMTIIDHGNSFYSIYGHASKLFVSKGSKVKEGQVIAVAGSGNSSEKDGIYFELRQNGQAVDPLPWLSISKQ
ncbi:MAG: peptidoglycan DD-metalloendopeptidase family protein [Nitrospirae bacterium]|nr:peptidoglycan DD-metalloendopeptidase family protein [Nitrospirota bacterium]